MNLRRLIRRLARTQTLARRFARPRAWIHVTYDAQPLFGLLQSVEITHVQTKALATVLETPADKKSKAFELRRVRM